jgi:hypothetical protein
MKVIDLDNIYNFAIQIFQFDVIFVPKYLMKCSDLMNRMTFDSNDMNIS